jgi:hypothetical protein
MGTQPKSGRLLWRLFTYVVLASAMPAAGGDLDAAGAAVERGRLLGLVGLRCEFRSVPGDSCRQRILMMRAGWFVRTIPNTDGCTLWREGNVT